VNYIDNSSFGVYHDQLSSNITEVPPRPSVNWQSVSTPGQSSAVIQIPSQPVGPAYTDSSASCDMAGYLSVMSDGGNSRDSWSSTSSNVVVVRPTATADQQWPSNHCQPPHQPTQYSHHVLQQQRHHLYDWAHRHTFQQVETNQSRYHQVYPQHVQQQQPQCQMFRYVNPRLHGDHGPTSTSSVRPHPYHHVTPHCATHVSSASSSGMRHAVTGIHQDHVAQYNLPTQLIAEQQNLQHGTPPGSVWVDVDDQRVGASSGHPVITYGQLGSSSQTPSPWYSVDNRTCTAMPAAQDEQQQHAGLIFSNSSDVSLSSNLGFPWSPSTCYDNSVDDWFTL